MERKREMKKRVPVTRDQLKWLTTGNRLIQCKDICRTVVVRSAGTLTAYLLCLFIQLKAGRKIYLLLLLHIEMQVERQKSLDLISQSNELTERFFLSSFSFPFIFAFLYLTHSQWSGTLMICQQSNYRKFALFSFSPSCSLSNCCRLKLIHCILTTHQEESIFFASSQIE